MRSYYDSVYLSPHADDVALSSGGRIFLDGRAGKSSLIVTVATADPPAELSRLAQRLHRRCALDSDAMRTRRREDRLAAHLLGADLHHLGLLDAVYRRDPADGQVLYPTLRSLFRRLHPADQPILAKLRCLLAELPAHGELVLPLAVGGHVDHRLTRRAAEALASKSLYFEDFPYVTQRRALRRALRPRRRWSCRVVGLTPEALDAKCRAAEAYASQIDMLFGSAARMRQRIAGWVEKTGGERLWTLDR